MTLTQRLVAPGWYRAALGIALGFSLGMGIVVAVRALYGWDPIVDWDAIITVGGLVAAPFGYLIGIGCFDYWFRWASGAPTIPEDHSSHGATGWRDYFRVNTDHKVIGIQYICTTFFFFVAGGLMAMLMRAELAQPGTQFVDPNTFNGLFSVHASLMIFLFIIPVFAGIANFVIPLMIGAPDMAFPRLNALSFWMLPVAGVMMLASYFAEGGAFATGWTAYAPLSTETPYGPAVLHARRAVRGRVVDRHRAQLPGHDHHDARAGDDVLAHAAARVGELHDLAARRDRHPVHRRLSVLRAARPHDWHALLRPAAEAGTCSCTSTSSGSTRTRRSTS